MGGVLEGGYALRALGRSVAETLAALSAPSGPVGSGSAGSGSVGSGSAGSGSVGSGGPWPREVMAAQERLSHWWPNLDPRA